MAALPSAGLGEAVEPFWLLGLSQILSWILTSRCSQTCLESHRFLLLFSSRIEVSGKQTIYRHVISDRQRGTVCRGGETAVSLGKKAQMHQEAICLAADNALHPGRDHARRGVGQQGGSPCCWPQWGWACRSSRGCENLDHMCPPPSAPGEQEQKLRVWEWAQPEGGGLLLALQRDLYLHKCRMTEIWAVSGMIPTDLGWVIFPLLWEEKQEPLFSCFAFPFTLQFFFASFGFFSSLHMPLFSSAVSAAILVRSTDPPGCCTLYCS